MPVITAVITGITAIIIVKFVTTSLTVIIAVMQVIIVTFLKIYDFEFLDFEIYDYEFLDFEMLFLKI